MGTSGDRRRSRRLDRPQTSPLQDRNRAEKVQLFPLVRAEADRRGAKIHDWRLVEGSLPHAAMAVMAMARWRLGSVFTPKMPRVSRFACDAEQVVRRGGARDRRKTDEQEKRDRLRHNHQTNRARAAIKNVPRVSHQIPTFRYDEKGYCAGMSSQASHGGGGAFASKGRSRADATCLSAVPAWVADVGECGRACRWLTSRRRARRISSRPTARRRPRPGSPHPPAR